MFQKNVSKKCFYFVAFSTLVLQLGLSGSLVAMDNKGEGDRDVKRTKGPAITLAPLLPPDTVTKDEAWSILATICSKHTFISPTDTKDAEVTHIRRSPMKKGGFSARLKSTARNSTGTKSLLGTYEVAFLYTRDLKGKISSITKIGEGAFTPLSSSGASAPTASRSVPPSGFSASAAASSSSGKSFRLEDKMGIWTEVSKGLPHSTPCGPVTIAIERDYGNALRVIACSEVEENMNGKVTKIPTTFNFKCKRRSDGMIYSIEDINFTIGSSNPAQYPPTQILSSESSSAPMPASVSAAVASASTASSSAPLAGPAASAPASHAPDSAKKSGGPSTGDKEKAKK